MSDLSHRDPPPLHMAHPIDEPPEAQQADVDYGAAASESGAPSQPFVSGTVGRLDLGRSGTRGGAYGRLERGGHHRVRGLLVIVGLAVVVLAALLTVGRPLVRDLAVNVAQANPQTMRLPFVADLVREQLGSALTDPAGPNGSPVQFVIAPGAGSADIAAQLASQQLVADPLAFEYVAVTTGQADAIQAGTYYLNQQMTPTQVLAALQDPIVVNPYITMALRSGLRIEQITAYLETLPLQKDVAKDFYDLASHPTAALRADSPFHSTLPTGRSLEGYLGWGTFSVKPDATADGIVRLLLTSWSTQVGQTVIDQATAKGLDFYTVLTLASIVDKEVAVPTEAPLIAGVYTNRLDPKKWSTGILNADPTVFYANDTMQLAQLPLDQWSRYSFWDPVTIADVNPPPALISYQTYDHPGLPVGPICSPTLTDIQAAIAPDTSAGYFFFVAKNDGTHTHAFAKTNAQFQQLLKQYGYIK
ncbi:MAG: endolytic transglycosylase MltG [Candidatus Limnocylindrales bacterium]